MTGKPRSRATSVVVPFLVVLSLVYLPKMVWPTAAIYVSVLTFPVLAVLAMVLKCAALAIAALFAARATSHLDEGNPVRGAWRNLGYSLASFVVGQCVLTGYELVLAAPPPLPSLGDLFWMGGYVTIAFSLFRFVRVYRASGFPVGTRREAVLLGGLAGAIVLTLAIALLVPIARGDQPLADRIVNVTYPLLDFVILVPMAVLLRITSRFRGGRVWTVWATLLAGFTFATGADIVFAYYTTAGGAPLAPLCDWMYVGSYALLATGCAQQYELLTD